MIQFALDWYVADKIKAGHAFGFAAGLILAVSVRAARAARARV